MALACQARNRVIHRRSANIEIVGLSKRFHGRAGSQFGMTSTFRETRCTCAIESRVRTPLLSPTHNVQFTREPDGSRRAFRQPISTAPRHSPISSTLPCFPHVVQQIDWASLSDEELEAIEAFALAAQRRLNAAPKVEEQMMLENRPLLQQR
jgi:hypothetical protein